MLNNILNNITRRINHHFPWCFAAISRLIQVELLAPSSMITSVFRRRPGMADGMTERLTQSALRVQMCMAMMTLSRAGDHKFDSWGRLLQGGFLWFPFFSGECRSRYQAVAYQSLASKLPQHGPVGPSRGGQGKGNTEKISGQDSKWLSDDQTTDLHQFLSKLHWCQRFPLAVAEW